MSSLRINEIFYSIQGESTWAGLPCVFVRLTGCNLRCRYCDTEYAFYEGKYRSVEEVVDEVGRYNCALVEVTGGEPLLQPGVHDLMRWLCDAGKTVLVETSGACDVSKCDPRPQIIRIMDLKTPGSGEVERNLWANIEHLRGSDEVKFVLCTREDYEWARDVIRRYDLPARVHAVLLSPVQEVPVGRQLPGIGPGAGVGLRDLAQWMLDDRWPANVRLQIQLHKLIWDPMMRGV
jgi:7-carboxy-7-deazaguanine synthase